MDKQLLLITVIESIYIYYMYNIFQTKISFHHPFEVFLQKKNLNMYIKHPVYTGIYESKICQFGKDISYFIILWLWIRLLFENLIITKINTIIFTIICICSFLMNMNAFIYLLPIYVYELYFINKKIEK